MSANVTKTNLNLFAAVKTLLYRVRNSQDVTGDDILNLVSTARKTPPADVIQIANEAIKDYWTDQNEE